MAATGHERYSEDLGAYLLGALPDLEAEALERHAMHCDTCRAELERLRPAADALPHSVEQYEPPPSLKASLMAAVDSDLQAAGRAPEPRRERRMSRLVQLLASRPAYALAGAAAVLVIGFAVGFGIDRATRGGSGGSRTLSAQIDRRAIPTGAAQLDVRSHGATTLRVQGMPVLRGGRVYEVWLQRGGTIRPAGALFAVMSDGSGAATITTGLRGADRVLVSRERAGGAPRPTEPPVISIRT